MTAVFERILEMSLTAAVVIAVIVLIRLLLRRAPRKYSYALWIVAAFRLVCPVSFQAFFSLFNFTRRLDEVSVETVVPDPVVTPLPSVTSVPYPGEPIVVDPDMIITIPADPVVPIQPVVPEPEVTVNLLEQAMNVAAVVWLVGLAVLLIYGVVSYIRLRRRMSSAVLFADNIWQSDRVQSPFILGFVQPKIYLPFGLSADQHRYVLAHENYHIKRFDHIVRPLSFLILAVHWFNPFVWLAYYMMGSDMEMSCDEKVLSAGESVKDYSRTLLSFAANRRFPAPSPLAFGESGVKGRIKNALSWKKPRTWVTAIAIAVCIAVIIVCAADPNEEKDKTEKLHEITSAVTAEELQSVEYYVMGEPGRSGLTDEQAQELARLLNALEPENFTYLPDGGGLKNGDLVVGMLSFRPDGTLLIRTTFGDGNGSVSEVAWWEVDSEELKGFVRSLSEQPETQTPETEGALRQGYYESVECIYQWPAISMTIPDDSGWYYQLDEDWLCMVLKKTGEATLSRPKGDWTQLDGETLDKMEAGTPMVTDSGLWDTLRAERPNIRWYEGNCFLLNFDGEVWIANGSYDGDGNIAIYTVFRLEKMDPEPDLAVQQLAVWYADLTHDGTDETISLTMEKVSFVYTLSVYNASGEQLWQGAVSAWRGSRNGYYLYEKDGKSYLMQWLPAEEQSRYSYSYRVFRLTEEGDEQILLENSFQYDIFTEIDILNLDLDGLRAFETEVNALLADTVALLVMHNQETILGDPASPLTSLWTSPADNWEQQQQLIQEEQADREGRTLAVWELNDLALTVLEGDSDYKKYSIDVYRGDYFFWSTSFDTHAGTCLYFRYEEGGTQYLMELSVGGGQGVGVWSYRVFSVRPESLPVLRENSLYYDSSSAEAVLAVDTDELRAFEAEVNALLEHAELIAGVENGAFFYGTPGSDTAYRWYTGEAERIDQRQEYWQHELDLLTAEVGTEVSRLAVEFGDRGNQKFIAYTLLDWQLSNTRGVAYVLMTVTEYDTNGNWLAEYAGVPVRLIFDRTDDGDKRFTFSELWVQEKGALINPNADVIEKFTSTAAGAVTNAQTRDYYVEQMEQNNREQAANYFVWYDVTVAEGIEVPGAVIDYAAAYIRQAEPDAQGAQIAGLEQHETAAVGLATGTRLYRLSWCVQKNGAWLDNPFGAEQVYLVIRDDWSGSSIYYEACGTVTQGEIDTVYGTEEMMAQYSGDPYLAAAAEIGNRRSGN